MEDERECGGREEEGGRCGDGIKQCEVSVEW
jgi:hypothetical protein